MIVLFILKFVSFVSVGNGLKFCETFNNSGMDWPIAINIPESTGEAKLFFVVADTYWTVDTVMGSPKDPNFGFNVSFSESKQSDWFKGDYVMGFAVKNGSQSQWTHNAIALYNNKTKEYDWSVFMKDTSDFTTVENKSSTKLDFLPFSPSVAYNIHETTILFMENILNISDNTFSYRRELYSFYDLNKPVILTVSKPTPQALYQLDHNYFIVGVFWVHLPGANNTDGLVIIFKRSRTQHQFYYCVTPEDNLSNDCSLLSLTPIDCDAITTQTESIPTGADTTSQVTTGDSGGTGSDGTGSDGTGSDGTGGDGVTTAHTAETTSGSPVWVIILIIIVIIFIIIAIIVICIVFRGKKNPEKNVKQEETAATQAPDASDGVQPQKSSGAADTTGAPGSEVSNEKTVRSGLE